jgi:DNA modification methylase
VRLGHDGVSIVGDDAPFAPSPLLAVDAPKIIWGGNHFADSLPASRGWLAWHKRYPNESNDQSDAELAWTDFLSVVRVFSLRWSGAHRQGREQVEPRYHVNQKPASLIEWCLSLVPDAQTILDPFMGSGTTLVAAKQLGRRAIGIEIEERYCEIAVQRLAQKVLDFGGAA